MPLAAPARHDVDPVVVRAVVERAGRVARPARGVGHGAGAWELPGGKLDPGEREAEGLAREVRAETGLNAAGDPGPWFEQPVRSPSGRRVLERVHVLRATGAPALSREHDALTWQDPAAPAPGPLTRSAATALALARSAPAA